MRADFWGSDSGSSDDAVAAADPEDLKKVLRMQREVEASAGGQLTGIEISAYQRVCPAVADVRAVWYRSAMLQLLAGPLNLLSRRQREGEFDDAVFSVAATLSMKCMQIGVVQDELPLDVGEFVREIENAAREKSLGERLDIRGWRA